MNIIILFDSYFGNTEKIARAMGESFNKNVNVKVYRISEITWQEILDTDILFVGSPTRGFQPSETTKNFLKSIPAKSLKGVKVAAFDTRLSLSEIKSRSVRFIVKTGGYAAKHIAKALAKKGGEFIITPEGFFVSTEKGPLIKGEIQRAANWAGMIVNHQLI